MVTTKETYCVYLHTFPNGKQYVGITKHGDCPNTRWKDGFGYIRNRNMFAAIVKYGWDNIKHDVLYSNLSQYKALKIEKELIESLDLTHCGYNHPRGNRCVVMCVETQEIFMSASEAQKSVGIRSNNSFWKAINNPKRTSGGKHWVAI